MQEILCVIGAIGGLALCYALLPWGQQSGEEKQRKGDVREIDPAESNRITILLSGDVMTGRGIDQALAHPSDPAIREPYVKEARDYVALTQHSCGEFHYPVDASYRWGGALTEWERRAPDLIVINLETSITTSDRFWTGKRIHYRMHPANTGVLAAAKIDVCALGEATMVPTRMQRFQATRASKDEALWLQEVLNREGRRWETRVELKEDNSLSLLLQ